MQPITKASPDPNRNNITYLIAHQLFDAVIVCPIKTPCKDHETNLTTAPPYFPASNTTRKPR